MSQYDFKFMTNLQTMIHKDNRVTTNQSNLFNFLIEKYTKQLKRAGHNSAALVELPWTSTLVPSLEEYTGATVSIVDDIITIRVPFNKTFIAEFRDVKNNTFEWSKEHQMYRGPFSTTALRIATTVPFKYFPTVRFCDNTTQLLADLKQYDATYWNPTLVSVGDTLVVAACNPVLGDILADVDLVLDSKTLYLLSQYGIAVQPGILDSDPKLKFAHSYANDVDLDNTQELVDWLHELGCTTVMYSRGLNVNTAVNVELTKQLAEKGISCVAASSYANKGVLIQTHSTRFTDRVVPYNSNILKVITLKNSRPVEVK